MSMNETMHKAWFTSAGGEIQFQLKNEVEDLLGNILANDSKTKEAFADITICSDPFAKLRSKVGPLCCYLWKELLEKPDLERWRQLFGFEITPRSSILRIVYVLEADAPNRPSPRAWLGTRVGTGSWLLHACVQIKRIWEAVKTDE
jgi:hypothetical protein